MRQWVLYILLYPSFCICQTVEQKYGDRIELLGVAFRDPLVLCQIFIAISITVSNTNQSRSYRNYQNEFFEVYCSIYLR